MVKRSSGNTNKNPLHDNSNEENNTHNGDNSFEDIREDFSAEPETEEGDIIPENESNNVSTPDAVFAEVQEKYLRLSAEFDNYRKRTLKEKADLIRTAGESIILKIIPVIDDLERAIGFLNGEDNPDASKEGIVLIYNKLKDILYQQGLKEIDTLYKDFDTDIHEAITKIPVQEKKLKGKVVEVIIKGYMLGDKVIRYPKVIVGE